VLPILSPQSDRTMLELYGSIMANAQCVLVSAPFALADEITKVVMSVPPGKMNYLLVDKEGSLGDKSEITDIEKIPANSVAFAATLPSNLTSFQNKLLKDSAESYHHAGVHIHSKIIVADPFGDDPVLVTGSANFSTNSTMHNDSNSLLVRGDTAITDIYATEFMRMFEQYHFRGAKKKADDKNTVITLSETDAWSDRYYVDGSEDAIDRMLFAGTLPPIAPGNLAVPTPPAPKPPSPKPPAPKPSAPKPSAPKPPAKKAAAKKASAKKATTKKASTKKASSKKASTKKAPSKKKSASTKKPSSKKAASKRPASTKSAAKKTSSKKAPSKKASSKKAASKKASAKKTSAKRVSAKKAAKKKSPAKAAKKSAKKSQKRKR